MLNPTEYGDERNADILRLLEDVHGFLVPVEPFASRDDEILIDNTWRLESDDAFAHIAEDFTDALRVMKVEPGGDKTIALRHDPSVAPDTVDVDVSADGVTITASCLRDAWRGTVWLERRMAWRHAPVALLGKRTLKPHFQRRITTSMFAMGLEKADDPHAYTADYLRNMAHLGYTQLFMYINLWEHCKSDILPDLGEGDVDHNLSEMIKLGQRAERFGIELVLMIAAPRIQPEHPVFEKHPELVGGIVMRKTGHALCTSEPLTHKFYAEQMRRLVETIPNIGAMAYLIGGEGFLHCYTRAVPRTEKVTNCKRCGEKRPHEVLAPLLDAVTGAVKDANPDVRVMYWPYTSYIWTHDDPVTYDYREDLALIRATDPRATWLIEIEKDAVIEVEDTGKTTVTDYSIQFIGPSHKMELVKPVLAEVGMELAVKTEVCIDASFSSMPYIPVMQRWLARQRAIHAQPAPVSWETWRFNGFWQSPSIEIAYWLDIEPELTDDEVLHRVASRSYGEKAAPQVIDAWQHMSDSWETFYRHYGTYWNGPLVLGPSHPFDLGHGFWMRRYYDDGFYQISPGMRESEGEAYLSDARNLRPRYALMPFTPFEPRHRHLTQVADRFAPGLTKLQGVMGDVPDALRDTAQGDLDIARMNYFTVLEDVEFHKFARIRDEKNYLPKLSPQHEPMAAQWRAIFEASIERAEQALKIVRRWPLIGWGYTFATRFTEAMIADKIDKTRELLERFEGGTIQYDYRKPPKPEV